MGNRILYFVLSAFLAVLAWIWQVSFSKMSQIEKELVEIKISIVRLQADVINRDEVVEIVKSELERHGIK